MPDPLWICPDGGATGRQAAEQFAACFWAEERVIAAWDGMRFRLVDGTRWYRVALVGGVVWGVFGEEVLP